MLKNDLKVALRNLLKHKGHSLINITGLAIGIAACLLLFLWVQDELSYDRYHENAERIYRVAYQEEYEGKLKRCASTQAPLGPALVHEFPWIQKSVRFSKSEFLVKCQDKIFHEDIFFADPDIFEVFSFTLLKGNPKTVLNEPNSILISNKIRQKYFGDDDPIGKTITIDERYNFKIAGVFKNIPRNSHFRFHFLMSILRYRKDYLNNWNVYNYYTYILRKKNSNLDLDTFRKEIPQIIEKYRGKGLREMYKMTYFLQPLTSIHLHSHLHNEIEPNRDTGTFYIFCAIALFILLIACLNYINLATARFVNRAREVGLRKVLGATPNQLLKQFLGESFVFALIALPPGILLSHVFLPLFNSLSGKSLALNYFNNLFLLGSTAGIILFAGLFAGVVPALFIMPFKPSTAFRGMIKTSPIIPVLRRSLVVFQFSLSILFIICTMIISDQLQYTRTKKSGIDKENVINIHMNHNKEALLKYETIKHELLQLPNVTAASASDFFPGSPRWNNNYWHDGVAPDEYRMIGCIPVDYDFIDTFRLNVVEGRGFSENFPTDENSAFILNEAAVKEFGWKSAVGKRFEVSKNWKKGKIIGVVEDFHFNSLHNKVEPVVLYIEPSAYEYFSVRINPVNLSQTLGLLERKWQELVPGQDFEYSFMDEDYNRLYKTEIRVQKIFMIVTILAIFIACMGLLGLAAFAAEKRTKEIGIRKVLGASVPGIIRLLSKEFAFWVLISNIIAWPIAWFAMNKWLQNFAYRIDILPWTFLFAGLIAFAIALLTVSYKSVRAASANPVDSLRYE